MSTQLASVLIGVVQFYVVLIFIYVIMTWFPVHGALYDVYHVLGSVVEPYVGIFRRFIPPMGGLDFSPWIAILVLQFVIVPLLRLV